MSQLEIKKWGSWNVAWVSSENPSVAIDALKSGKADALGVSPHNGYKSSDISFLVSLKRELKALVLPYSSQYDLSVLQLLPNLKMLVVGDTKQKVNYQNLIRLEELNVEWKSVENLPAANVLIKQLSLRGYKCKANNLTELPAYLTLERIELVHGNLTSLAGIEKFPHLKSASFSYMTKLEHVGSLAKTPVEAVLFESCKKISDLPELARCPNLRLLGCFKCADLDSLNFIAQSNSLEEFRFVRTKVVDGNMLPLLKLKSVAFLNERHFSHTEEEIKELIGEPIVPWDLTAEEGNKDRQH